MLIKVFLIILYLSIAMFSLIASADTNDGQHADVDKRLIDIFNEQCGTEQMSLLGFPDVYLDRNTMAACEIAFVTNPERYAKQYKTRLIAQSLEKATHLDSDQYEASRIIAKKFKRVYHRKPTEIDLALAGHPESFYALLIHTTPLSSKQLVAMKQLIGESLTEVLFGPFIDSEYKPSEADLIAAVEQTLFHAQYMSGAVLEVATQNIRAALAKSYVNQSVSETYLSMPERLRRSLLALASISNNFSPKEFAILRATQYPTNKRWDTFYTGERKHIFRSKQSYLEAEFIWRSYSIEDARMGLLIYEPAIVMLEELQSLINRHHYLLKRLAKYFTGINYEEILDINTQSLRERFVEAIRSHSLAGFTEFEVSLLIADIRYAATKESKDNTSGITHDYINAISPDNPFVLDLLDQHINPLAELAFKTKLTGKWERLSYDVTDLIEHISSNIDTICAPHSEEICDRMWRIINNSDPLFYGHVTSECQVTSIILPILHRQLRAGQIQLDSFFCSLESLGRIFARHKDEMIFLLTLTTGSDQNSNAGLLAFSDFVSEGGGLVAKHIYTASVDIRKSPYITGIYSSSLSDSKAWAYINEIAANPVPLIMKSAHLFLNTMYPPLAEIYSRIGNNERALSALIVYLDNSLNDPIYDEDTASITYWLVYLPRLKRTALSAGVPYAYIDSLIGNYRKYYINQDLPHVDKTLSENLDDPFIDAWRHMEIIKRSLSSGDLHSVFSSISELESDVYFPEIFGEILALSNADRDVLCSDKIFQKFAYSNKGISKLIRLLDKYLFLSRLEYVTFEFQCGLVRFRTNQLLFDAQSTTIFGSYILNTVIPFIKSRILITEPRFTNAIEMISDYSSRSSSTVGLTASLIALKHSFEYMADAFIFRNSSTWRLQMSGIETVIVNTMKGLRDAKIDSTKQKAIHSRLLRRAESFATSAHAIFTSDRTRARLLDVENRTYTETARNASIRNNTTAYNKMTEYFHAARISLAESKTISEAIVNKARFGEHGLQAIPRFYKASAQIEKARTSPKEVFPTSNNSVLLNILSNGRHLYFQLLDDKGRYLSDTMDIQASLASRLKERITRNAKITTDDINLGCEAFAEVHHVLKPLIKDYRQLVVVPSVNLLPIPTEIIIGTACGSSDATIIHAADVLAAIELMRSDQGITLPQSFVGIGNPSLPLESNQINIAAVDGGSREIVRNLSAIDEFQPLPDAEEEILEIAEIFDDTSIFTAAEGSIKKGLEVAQFNRQKGKNSAIVLATHGVGLDLGQGFELPSLLSVEDGRPTLIGATAVQQFDLEGSIVVLSACDTAAGLYEKPEMMFTGFVESFADAQSSFIVASMLPVRSKASKQHSVAFFRALKNGDIWQAARAGKEALSNATDSLPFVYIYP